MDTDNREVSARVGGGQLGHIWNTLINKKIIKIIKKIGFSIRWIDGLKIIRCNATEINISDEMMFKATMQSTDFWNIVIKINVRLQLPVQIGVDVDHKKMYEVLFCIHDSAHKSLMFSEESRQYQNTGFSFFSDSTTTWVH